MTDYTLPVGPLSTTCADYGTTQLGFLEIADNNGSTEFLFTPAGASAAVVGVVTQPLDDLGNFGVTFTLPNGDTYALTEGTVVTNFEVNATFAAFHAGSDTPYLSGELQAQLLPISAPIKISDVFHADGHLCTLAVDAQQNLTFTLPSGETIALGNIAEAFNENTGELLQYTFESNGQSVTLSFAGHNYTWIKGTFTCSTKGSGTIGPPRNLRQSGDDTWIPAGQ